MSAPVLKLPGASAARVRQTHGRSRLPRDVVSIGAVRFERQSQAELKAEESALIAQLVTAERNLRETRDGKKRTAEHLLLLSRLELEQVESRDSLLRRLNVSPQQFTESMAGLEGGAA